jgi:hypothetical protein
MEKRVPIPEPPGWPILGNILNIDFELPLRSLCNLADKHGKLSGHWKEPLEPLSFTKLIRHV